jgi:hypothetical protein
MYLLDQTISCRFLSTRFSYSPPTVVPHFFMSKDYGPFLVPDEFPHIVARLSQRKFGHTTKLECSADFSELHKALKEFEEFSRQNPNWIEKRFVKHNKQNTNKHENDIKALDSDNGMPSFSERQKAYDLISHGSAADEKV